MKGTTLLTAGALALVLGTPVFAADYGTSSSTSGSSMSNPSGAATAAQAPSPSNSWKASDLMNKDIKNSQGQNLGKVSDLVVDTTGKAYVVLCDCAANNHYAVPWNRLSMAPGNNNITLDVNKDQLRSEFSAFEPSGNVSNPSGGANTDTSGGMGSESGGATDNYSR